MIIKYDNKAIKYTNKWISVDSEPGPTPPGPTPVEYVQIGNLLWKTANTNIDIDTDMVVVGGQHYYNDMGLYSLSNQLTDGWRVPTYDDFLSLIGEVNYEPSPLCATSPDWSGTNTTGFTALPKGKYSAQTSSVEDFGTAAYFRGLYGFALGFNTESITYLDRPAVDIYCPVRLCKDVT